MQVAEQAIGAIIARGQLIDAVRGHARDQIDEAAAILGGVEVTFVLDHQPLAALGDQLRGRAAGNVDDARGAVGAGRDDAPTVARRRERAHAAGRYRDAARHLRLGDVPDVELGEAVGRDQVLAVVEPDQRIARPPQLRIAERAPFAAARVVDGDAFARGRDVAAVVRHRDPAHGLGIAKDARRFTRVEIDELKVFVAAPKQPIAVDRKRHVGGRDAVTADHAVGVKNHLSDGMSQAHTSAVERSRPFQAATATRRPSADSAKSSIATSRIGLQHLRFAAGQVQHAHQRVTLDVGANERRTAADGRHHFAVGR